MGKPPQMNSNLRLYNSTQLSSIVGLQTLPEALQMNSKANQLESGNSTEPSNGKLKLEQNVNDPPQYFAKTNHTFWFFLRNPNENWVSQR